MFPPAGFPLTSGVPLLLGRTLRHQRSPDQTAGVQVFEICVAESVAVAFVTEFLNAGAVS